MATQFRINGTTYSLLHLGSRVTTPSYCYRQGGITYYTPLLTSRSQTIGNYTYNASSPTVCVRYNNTTYYAAKSRTASYDIPAGTYTPSAFKNLIDKYISPNDGSRGVSNSFNATVNGQTITVKANTTIWNINNSSSGSSLLSYGVNFSGSYMNAGNAFGGGTAHSFIDNKVYITQSKGISYFNNYMHYNITISTGIKFK